MNRIKLISGLVALGLGASLANAGFIVTSTRTAGSGATDGMDVVTFYAMNDGLAVAGNPQIAGTKNLLAMDLTVTSAADMYLNANPGGQTNILGTGLGVANANQGTHAAIYDYYGTQKRPSVRTTAQTGFAGTLVWSDEAGHVGEPAKRRTSDGVLFYGSTYINWTSSSPDTSGGFIVAAGTTDIADYGTVADGYDTTGFLSFRLVGNNAVDSTNRDANGNLNGLVNGINNGVLANSTVGGGSGLPFAWVVVPTDTTVSVAGELGAEAGNKVLVSATNAVPEPGSLSVLALGAVGLLARRRRTA